MTGRIGRDEARNLMLEYARDNNRDDGTRAITNLASSARLNLIIDQNASMAKAVGDYERMYSSVNKKLFPYVIYHASVGSRTPRSEHQRYDGMIFEKDDPWLKTHWPPWAFNCHCRLENCTDKKAHKTPDLIQPPTPADKVTVDTKSGYSFDPAHAFEKFDFSAIKDPGLRKNAREGVEKIMAGESPASPSSSDNIQETNPESVGPEQTYTTGEQKSLGYAIEKIGNAKKEHLLVFDSNGNVEYEETGKKRHVGYSTDEISYEGKIAVHNHPEGVFPYFSQQDLDTFHSKKIRMAATVSKDYIITIKKDENFPHEQSRIDITNGRDYRNSTIKEQISETYRQLRNAKSKAEYDELRERYIQLKLQYQADMAADAGYKLSWVKREDAGRLLEGKPNRSDKDFLAREAAELKRRVAAESSRKVFPKNPKEKLPKPDLDKAKDEARRAVPSEVMDTVDKRVGEIGKEALQPFIHYSSRPGDSENIVVRQAGFKDGKLDWTGVKVSEKRKQAVADLQKLLDTMPKFEGTVYRGCSFEKKEDAEVYLQKLFGNPKNLSGFISTTPDPVVARHYAAAGKFKVVVVVPNSQNGVYFGPYSTHPEDEEALISYKFYLKGLKTFEEDGILYVLAEEVAR